VLDLNRTLELPIARRLRAQHPGWNETRGACPRCVLEAINASHAQRRTDSLALELQLPYPVYSYDETALLPTPYRVHAYPQFTGRGVVIAFLDSGFYPHPDLTEPYNRILAHIDATTRVPVERPNFRRAAGTSWHGLMTTAVAAGNGSLSDFQYRGIASDAQLVLVKTGNRRGRHIHEQDIFRALEWVILNQHRYNIRVVNISVGGDLPSTGALTPLDELVEEAVARGMVVVCAVGNSGTAHVIPPASAPSALTVGGVDDRNSLERTRHRLFHSNFGSGGQQVSKPELIAPAIWIAAPMLPRTRVYNEGRYLWKLVHAPDRELQQLLETRQADNKFKKETLALPLDAIRRAIRQRMIELKYIHAHYQHVDGTSMAAPIVSAVVAQMLEANPTLTPANVKAILTQTARRLEHLPFPPQGAGVLNAPHAVAYALRAPGGALAGQPLSPHIQDSITFYYYDVDARRVAVIGDWNGWNPHTHRMLESSAGAWRLTVPRLHPGKYAYKFLVERDTQRQWLGDPENLECIPDGAGGFYSLLEIPT
jgi:serine protease AprX